MPLASVMARKKSLSAPPHVSFEELQSAAYMGLVDAARRFDASKGFAFSSFARLRIEGEMKDHMRLSMLCDKIRLISDGEDFESRSELTPSDIGLDISFLEDRERKMLLLYYLESKTMKEIGDGEGLSESRVSQIIGSCRKKLKKVHERRK
jgi:RNA polymerase sigma factor (sigma-70 family)